MTKIVTDDEERKQKLLFYLELLLCAISTWMTVINIFTHKTWLLFATAATAVISLANALLLNRGKKYNTICTWIFSVKIFLLFDYFIIFGGTEGFSTIWLLLLPACGMAFFGRKIGGVMAGVLLLELVLFFYTPLRAYLQCDYTQSFLQRFPVLYFSFFLLGYYLEYTRELTYDETIRLKKEFEFHYCHDQLTGLFNRFGFHEALDRYVDDCKNGEDFGLLIADIDHFKRINDRYGHITGDEVLKAIAERIVKTLEPSMVACRWGGEEFAILVPKSSFEEIKHLAETLRENMQQPMLIGNEIFTVTISIGAVYSRELKAVEDRFLIAKADERLYRAKENGRNQCVFE